jgi:hypothetical protein
MSRDENVEEKSVDEEVKHYVFIKEGRRHYAPQSLLAGETTNQWIFRVPESNAVGTLDKQSNGIVFLKFGDYWAEPESAVVAKDFSREVYGEGFNYRFSPTFSGDTIVYCKTRTVVVVNVKTGEAFHAGCGLSIGNYLFGIRVLDPHKSLFVIAKSIDNSGRSGWKDYLHVAKLEGQKFIDAGWSMPIGDTYRISFEFPRYNAWYVHDRKLFVYDQEQNKIVCTDGTRLVLSPFSEVFNANIRPIGLVKDFAIHPTHPFGVIIEESAAVSHDLLVLRWNIANPKKKDRQVISFSRSLEQLRVLFGMDRVMLAYQSISPDGNWYVVGFVGRTDGNESRSPHFVAIPVTPVDKKHPYFLDIDNLVILGQVAGLTSIAWTSEPTSYVVSNGELLYKWDLGELPNARFFEIPEDGAGQKKASIFRKIGRLFGASE